MTNSSAQVQGGAMFQCCSYVPGLAQCLRGNNGHVAIVFCPQGGLWVVGHVVFTNAMATFSQCGLANFQHFGAEEVSLASPAENR